MIRPAVRLRTLMLLVAALAVALGGLRYLNRPRGSTIIRFGRVTWTDPSTGVTRVIMPHDPYPVEMRPGRILSALDWSDGRTTWHLHIFPWSDPPQVIARRAAGRP